MGLGLALVGFIEEGASCHAGTVGGKSRQSASANGEHILAVEGNVTCYADYQRAVDQILTRSGKLDCFIGNAAYGITMPHWLILRRDAETGFHELLT